MLKPAQTGVAAGEPGDLADVARLAAPDTVCELARYPDPLAPATAARRAGRPPLDPEAAAAGRRACSPRDHDLVLVEGAGGLLVRFTDDGGTLADVAGAARRAGARRRRRRARHPQRHRADRRGAAGTAA